MDYLSGRCQVVQASSSKSDDTAVGYSGIDPRPKIFIEYAEDAGDQQTKIKTKKLKS